MAIMRHFNRHCSRISHFFLSGNISSRWIFPFFMDVKKRWSKKEKSLKSDPAPENTKQNTKILVNDLFFLYSFSYEIFVTWKFELFSQCFFTVVCLSSMLMHCNASTWVPINVNPQGLATFFGPHLPLYCTCNISCYESSSEIYSMEIKISLSLSFHYYMKYIYFCSSLSCSPDLVILGEYERVCQPPDPCLTNKNINSK